MERARGIPIVLGMVALLAGCATSSVPKDVADSVDVLHKNTHKLSTNYEKLLGRSEPPPLPPGPAGEPQEEQAKRQKKYDASWRMHVLHQKALMRANNTLADRVKIWARKSVRGEEDAPDDP